MIPVYLNGKSKPYQFPENWNELTAESLIAISVLLLKKDVSLIERSYIAWKLTDINNDAFGVKASRKPGGYDYFANELIDKLVPATQWLYQKNTLTKQLIPEIEVGESFQFFGTRKLYGPTDAFNNLTIAEFSDTESCLGNYEATNDEMWLNRFLAVLYRPKKKGVKPTAVDYDGDIRQGYNFHLNDFGAVMLSGVDARIKAAVLLWYYGCRNEITEQNSFLFTKGKGSGDGSFTDVIHALAGPKFGTLDEAGRVPLKVALHELKLMHQANG